MTYDPDLIDRLVREARDPTMKCTACCGYGYTIRNCPDSGDLTDPCDVCNVTGLQSIANQPAMSDQLEAARMEVERLEALVSVSPDDIRDVVVENDRMHEAFDQAMKKLRAGSTSVKSAMCTWCGQHWPMLDGEPIEVFRRYTNEHANQCPANDIRIERDAMRMVVEAAEAWRADNNWPNFHALTAAIDAYRAAKGKT